MTKYRVWLRQTRAAYADVEADNKKEAAKLAEMSDDIIMGEDDEPYIAVKTEKIEVD